MSRENVEIVRRWVAAISASPEEALAAIAAFFDANVEADDAGGGTLDLWGL